MLTLAAHAASSDAARNREEGAIHLEIADSLRSVERLWRSFEESSVMSPYQRFDWVAAFAEADGEVRVATVRDAAGRPVLILPLELTRRLGLRIAASIGGKHANFQVPPMAAAYAAKLDGTAAQALLRRIGREVGADTLALTSVPTDWDGAPNPFGSFGQTSPSNAYEVRLCPDPEATALRTMSNEARKRLRNKERGLAKLGEVSFMKATDPDGVERLLDAFYRQKDTRFRELGIPDPFLDTQVREAMRRGALDGLAGGRPAIELYGLCVGERVTAVLGGAADERRLSGMFISFESCKEATKYSPGDILVSRVIREQCLAGRRFFDLGVGEARYKRTFCDETVELVDVFLPVTAKGRAYAALAGMGLDLKRRIKKNPQAMALLARLRRAKAKAAA